jgi:hypothetical protein
LGELYPTILDPITQGLRYLEFGTVWTIAKRLYLFESFLQSLGFSLKAFDVVSGILDIGVVLGAS